MRRSNSSDSSLSSSSLKSSTSLSSVDSTDGSYSGDKDYVMVIGGCGYIGSHTALELLKDGYNVIVVDDLSNSYESVLDKVRTLAKKYHSEAGSKTPSLSFHKLDYRSPLMRSVLGRYTVRDPGSAALSHIKGSVEESIHRPLDYYRNNVCGLVELLVLLGDFGINNFVFSSSATVYGSKANEGEPLHEEHLIHHPEEMDQSPTKAPAIPGAKGLTSPYGRTKYFSEAILADVAQANPSWRITALRYFNPVGSEPFLGEDPRKQATNLFPVIAQVLTGARPTLDVFGSDWDTRDGTATRDFIHVVDLARGHLAALSTALDRPQAFRAYNLGTGNGCTVAEVVRSMESAAGRSIPVRWVDRRLGDVGYCVAATDRAAHELGWKTAKSLSQCAEDAWRSLQLSGSFAG
ncbi:hypothetical protein D0868_07071 [Hortaea werneckii]|uniref:NAD-dependent epimerase/dehydratase domain-containing protein n=1 Tax=Hortaea werneckii TaxID=91943 RepID=A0A3M6YME6_HORWE|nr:hypothetical protein D0868_07071 [Hortaea werneckii]